MKNNISALILTRGNKDLSSLKKSLNFCSEILISEDSKITDFAKARNDLLKKAKSQWILFLDDDEEVSESLKNEILLVIKDRNLYSGFYLKRENYFLNQYVGSNKIVRLIKKDSGIWKRKVHEVLKVRGKVGHLKNSLLHHTSRSASEMINKINLYSSIHAEENLKEGKKSSIFKIIFFPILKFFESLFSKRGFVFSLLQSFHSFLSWSKQWKLQKDLI